ncbi:hypothetical protein BCON_0022g00070 [Botryotinia convoluta]|uniref:Uncharacterized protein n=1 Tax=Botryotinia convoluta TaxID=54673 RepID=A0A4Z1IS16_9HELO|nr:hypothetical protein BCON_0022g00070 [Botryotinia convoluta]
MSTTITDNPITISSRQTLAEYDIHHTGDDRGMNDMIVPPNTSNILENVDNPSSWPRDQYRIPNYRPINRHLIAAERPNGSNGAERVFITMMLTGVSLNAIRSGPSMGYDRRESFYTSISIRYWWGMVMGWSRELIDLEATKVVAM